MALAQSVASHYAAASKGRLSRCTVLGSTPNRTAILRTLSPVSLRAFRAAEMRASMNIELTACRRFMQGVERWPLVLALGAADAVIFVDVDLPPSRLGRLLGAARVPG